MVKKVKKIDHEKIAKRKNLYMSIFILLIMVFSLAGFAMMYNGGSGTTSSSTNGQLPKNLALHQVNQKGQIYWVAVKNYELFVFNDIGGYDLQTKEATLAKEIMSKKSVNIYIDKGFSSPSAIFLVERALKGVQIDYSEISAKQCSNDTLVFTNNTSFSGNCMKFISSNADAYQKANYLVYFMVKN